MGKLSFWFWSLYFWNMSIFVFVLDAIFCGTNFFIFQDSVWLVKKSWWVHCCSNHQFHWVRDRCRSGFVLWWFLSEESCRHKLVVSTTFWSWLMNASSVLTSLKWAALICWLVNALWVCWLFMGFLDFGVYVSEILLFFVFVLDTIFCCTNFFIFQDSVWLVKKSWWVQCCSNHQFHWVSDRCRSGFVLWRFLSQESCRHKLVVSTSFWSWLLNVPSVLTSLKYTATVFLVDNTLWVCWHFLRVLSLWFWSLCFWNISFFCVCSWCDLLWYKFFHFPGQCVAS